MSAWVESTELSRGLELCLRSAVKFVLKLMKYTSSAPKYYKSKSKLLFFIKSFWSQFSEALFTLIAWYASSLHKHITLAVPDAETMCCICHVKTPTIGRESKAIHKEKYYWPISQSRHRQKVPGNKASRSEVWIWNCHQIAWFYLPSRSVCCHLQDVRRLACCQGGAFRANSVCWSIQLSCSDTCHLFPDRVWTQSTRVSPGFERRSPILRGHCLPGFLRSCSQRLAQYAEREYTGKSVMHIVSLLQHSSHIFNSLSPIC